ncbi:MAG TPA: TraR/DksA C4-type zinc finger protein [Candidatus Binatia bacterium]|jgi:RNA polymerase-binding protein DksA
MNERKKKLIDSLAKDLRRTRAALLGDMDETQGELKTIAEEREPELEEDAQKGRIATVLERLSDRDKQTLDEIDAALKRSVDGTYGKCERCGKPIAVARLKALPTTRLCIDCARAREGTAVGGLEEETPETELPPDLSLLDDEEIEAVLYGLVRDAGDIDMEELEISSRDGAVYLEGALPSEKEHHTLLELLHDVGGLGDVIDHLAINPIAWERTDRSKTQSAEERPDTGVEETEDVTDEADEGQTYRPPLKPPPREEMSSSRRGSRRN